jgi:hypothetical protein
MSDLLNAHLWWPIAAVLLAMAFAIGIAVGRQLNIDSAVDRVLRRETKFRHPARPAVSSVSGPKFVSTTREPSDAVTRLRRALSDATAPVVFGFDTVGWGGPIERCGKPVITALGEMRCGQTPGHDGGC